MFKSLIRTFAIVAAFIAGYMMPGLHVYQLDSSSGCW